MRWGLRKVIEMTLNQARMAGMVMGCCREDVGTAAASCKKHASELDL